MRRQLFAAAAVLTLAAACGGSDDNASDSSNATSTTGPAAALEARRVAPFGRILTANGRTLYVFAKDRPVKPKSTCNDACASTWPPLLVSGPGKVADDLDASLLGETTRDDGAKQHTWNGWPLYVYTGDTLGETKGQGVGGVWHVVGADGEPVVAGTATTTTGRGATTTMYSYP